MIPRNLKKISNFLETREDYFDVFGSAAGGLSFVSLRAFIRLTAKSFQESHLDINEFRQLKYKYFLAAQWEFYRPVKGTEELNFNQSSPPY